MMNFKCKKAQTAVELAVFGSILIFVMGATIRTVMSRAQQQTALLKATRMALTMSHKTTETKQVAGRNMGTVLIVEDRLTAASSKYGAVDRMPFMTQGAGVHSANLFMPVDYGDSDDLPVFDMYVNGTHFAFRTAAFKYIHLADSCAGAAPCSADCKGDCSAGSPQWQRGSSIPAGADYWEDNCLSSTTTTTTTLSCADPDGALPWACPDPSCTDCTDISVETYMTVTVTTSSIGCAKLYAIVNNHPLIPDWCNGGVGTFPIPCPPACSAGMVPGCNLSANERFDLDRADATNPNGLDGIPGAVSVPVGERPGFAWQWFLVSPIDETWRDTSYNYSAGSLSMDPMANTTTTTVADLIMAEGIVLPGGENNPKNISLDVDYDLKLESIMANVAGGAQPNSVATNGIITRIGVMDTQEGDIDFSYNDSDELKGVEMYGFTKDVNLYTFVRGSGAGGGTYLQIDEGQLYSAIGDSKQYIRTASKKDQADLIERVFRLSNNTGAFCSAAGVRPAMANGISNPVEVCSLAAGGCFTGGAINRTCMDIPNNLIFIRSRIQDLHGRKWVTDTSEDSYVEFVID